jgi:hypothetical protein
MDGTALRDCFLLQPKVVEERKGAAPGMGAAL